MADRRPKYTAEHRWMQCCSVVFIVTIQQMSIKKHHSMMIPKFNTYTRQLVSKYCFVTEIWHSPYWSFMVRYNSWRVKIIWELFLDIRTESDQVMFLTNKKILTSLRWSNFGSFHLPAHKPIATVTTCASCRFAFQTDGRPPGNRFKRRSLNNGWSNCRHRWEGVTTAPARLWGRHCSTTELPTDRYLTTDHFQTGVACVIQLFLRRVSTLFCWRDDQTRRTIYRELSDLAGTMQHPSPSPCPSVHLPEATANIFIKFHISQ